MKTNKPPAGIARLPARFYFKAANAVKWFACIVLAAVILFPYPAVAAQDSRGVAIIRIKDANGKDMNLYAESHALIIGVSNYTSGWPKLPGVREDVNAMRSLLGKQGFNVTVVEDPNRRQMNEAFDDFINRHGLKQGNRLLIYFAGHGHTIKQSYDEEMGYIIPTDAPNPNRDLNGFLAKAMDMQQIEVYAKRIQAKHVMFLFDSCFSGSIFSLSRAVPENISYKTARPVRQFITSGSADETVPDKSIFRQQVVSALNGEADIDRDGYVTGTELGEFLQNRVLNYSKGAQHPQYGKIRNPNLDKGDYVFAYSGYRRDTGPSVSTAADNSADAERVRREREELEKLRDEKRKLEDERRRLEMDMENQRIASEKEKLKMERERLEQIKEEQERNRRRLDEKSKLAYIPKDTSQSTSGYISAIEANITTLRFFETGWELPEYGKRQYLDTFRRGSTRFISWELNMTHPKHSRRINYDIDSVWYKPDGTVFYRGTRNAYVEPNWSSSWQSASCGWANYSPTNWPVGVFRVELFVSGQKIATGTFQVAP